MAAPTPAAPRRLYCHCAYAKVVAPEVKDAVLRALGDAPEPFEAVPDLCEMAARKDPALARLAAEPGLRIVACYPRAVRWLFHGAGTPLADQTEFVNMRTCDAPAAIERALSPDRLPPEPEPETVPDSVSEAAPGPVPAQEASE